MLVKVQLYDNKKWDTRRFHQWYMDAAKAGMKRGFTIKIAREYFHLPGEEPIRLPVEFCGMYNLLWEENLNIVQVTLFTL
jgi:hypothetical protein